MMHHTTAHTPLDIHTTADILPHTGDPHTLMVPTLHITPHLICHTPDHQDIIMSQSMITYHQLELSTLPQSEKRLYTLLHTPQ